MTGENGHSGHVGTIVEIRGVVIDAVFPGGHLPSIYNALEISLPATDGSDSSTTLVAEVQQHVGDGRVRAIAMDATDGLSRGLDVIDTQGPITVPVGEVTLGRIFNVLGEPVDHGDALPEGGERWQIHRDPPRFEDLSPTVEIFETGIKVIGARFRPKVVYQRRRPNCQQAAVRIWLACSGKARSELRIRAIKCVADGRSSRAKKADRPCSQIRRNFAVR